MSRHTRPMIRLLTAAATLFLVAGPPAQGQSSGGSTGASQTETVGGNETISVGSDQSPATSSKPKEIVVVGSKVKDTVNTEMVALSLRGSASFDLGDTGRTGLAAGRYVLELPPRTAYLGERIRIRLKSFDHRPGSPTTARELAATFEGCARAAAPRAGGQQSSWAFLLQRAQQVGVHPQPDGGLELRVQSHDDPSCILAALLPPAVQHPR